MFQHVLLFKFKDPEECVEEVGRRLMALPAQIHEIRDLSYHANELHTHRSYDACLIVTFDNEWDYRIYDTHPLHNEARQYIHQHVLESHTADYHF